MNVATMPMADETRACIDRTSFVSHRRWELVEGAMRFPPRLERDCARSAAAAA